MRKTNRILSLLLTVCLLFGMSLTTVSAASTIRVYVDGTRISMDADPIIVNERTLVPITAIVDHLGGTADWDGMTGTATFRYKGTTIVLQINSTTAVVNGQQKQLDVAPIIVTIDSDGGGRTMVPLRFVAETLNFEVDWNDATRSVYITSLPDAPADGTNISIYVNEAKLRLDASPILVNERTLVPVSTIVDYLGGTADWDGDNNVVTLNYNGTEIVLKIGSVAATVNGEKYTMDVTPRIVEVADGGGRTMVPIRFIAEHFNFKVDWDGNTQSVLITTKDPVRDYTITEMTLKTGQQSGDVYYTTILLRADKSLKDLALEGVFLSNPYRYYIDIPNASFRGSSDRTLTLDEDNSYVSAVRTGTHSNGTLRIVVDLKGNLRPYLSYSTDGNSMIIAFRDSGAPANGTAEQTAQPVNGNEGTGDPSLPDPAELGKYTPAYYNPWADGKLVVVIDPGHGKTTGGKRSPDSTLMEWEFNRDVAYKLKAQLEARGVTCVMTVDYDDQTDPALAERVERANAVSDGDLFVSVHGNAYGNGEWNSANGWEIYVNRGGDINGGASRPIAEVAAKYIESATTSLITEFRDRGVKEANFVVIKDTYMPAVLIEHGFYTNWSEAQLMKSQAFRTRLAEADCAGIMNFFNSYL